MNEAFGFHHFLSQLDLVGRGVLLVLLFMSVGSWIVIVRKCWELLRLKGRRKEFLTRLKSCRDLPSLSLLVGEWSEDEPFGRVARQGLAAARGFHDPSGEALFPLSAPDEWVASALRNAVEHEEEGLETGITLVATVSAAAPFVGLFGTVWSIYHALVAIGLTGEGGLEKVAGPVGEALIMTGIGLAVAIPALLGYNAILRSQRMVVAGLENFSETLFAWFATGHRPLQEKIFPRRNG